MKENHLAWIKHLEIATVAVILLLAAFLRLYHLKETPGWWPDEGVMLNITGNLLRGKAQFFALTYPYVPHPIGYFLLAAPFVKILGYNIISLRIMSAVAGILSVYFLYRLGKIIYNAFAGLIASAIFAVYPFVLVQSRTGLDYNILTLFFIITLYFLVSFLQDPQKTNKYLLACLFAGLAPTISYLGIVAPVITFFTGILQFKATKKYLLYAILLLILPLIFYLVTIFTIDKSAVIHDFNYMISRRDMTQAGADDLKFHTVWSMIGSLPVLVWGFAGLYFARGKNRVLLVLFSLFLIILELKTRGFWWYISTFVFFFALGWGIFAGFLVNLFKKNITGQVVTGVIFILVTGFLFKPYITKSFSCVTTPNFFGLNEEKDFSPQDLSKMNEVVAFINQNTKKDDMVLASAHISWQLHSQITDPILSYIYTDRATVNFPADMRTTGRFVYDPSYKKAKYLLDDQFMRNWFIGQPGIKDGVLNDIYNNWDKVFDSGEFKVYENPALK